MKQESYETGGVVSDGKLKVSGQALFTEAMRRFPNGFVRLRVDTARPSRSSQQNRFWHGVVIPAFAEHLGYEFEEMKDALALKLIPLEVTDIETGEVKIVPGHTSALNTKAFNDLIERAQRFGAGLGVYVPDPNEAVR
jgi:hypothetical protein